MSARRAAVLSLAVVAAALWGCDVDPYCVTCGDPDDGGADADLDAAADAFLPDVFVPDAGPGDGGLPDGCLEIEICNELDDDCDGEIDEDFDLMRDTEHCGGCDVYCGPPHALPECVDGACGIASCAPEFHDLDGDLDNGCEYRCVLTDTEDSLCDFKDNDCDGETDEDIDFDNDPVNCGTCGRVCSFSHATATCVTGDCTLDDCDDGWYDIDGRAANGCEYACTPADPPVEVCNLRDDDCDGVIDDGDPGGGESCGSDEGACSVGTTTCVGGTIQCSGSVEPTTELCNGIDDDCDGVVDQGDPEGGRLCGTGTGTCEQGREHCVDGGLVCTGAVGPEAEACDGLDNDCDGTIDNGDPGGGGTCGDDTGACEFGTLACSGGVLVCTGGTGPSAETCNGIDDDCDGVADQGNPEGGGLCGDDLGTCSPGVQECTGGSLVCVGAVGPDTEVCDGLDNDCDGVIDDGDPGGGGSCGIDTGACEFGTYTCAGGTLVCTGGTDPTVEVCNLADDDCDGSVDEDFDTTTDVLNCGACGRACALDNATPSCVGGDCVIVSCEPGYHDLDGDPLNGCEYECTIGGGEVCNGLDDDCNGVPDDGVIAPTSYCNPNGVCAGTPATCGGSAGWVCVYGAGYEESEASCDGLDNDCNGIVDVDAFPLFGTSCTNGELGACLDLGTYVCNAAGDNVECDADPSLGGAPETCNGRDDDCDGVVDDGMTPSIIPTVPVPRSGGGTVYVMQYEASRPDASPSSAGSLETHACGTGDRVPWTTLTWAEARDACCALNATGTCSGDGSGWRLCDAADWQTACEGPVGACDWSYATSCDTSQRLMCNGREHDCDPGTPQDEDCLYNTGSSAFPGCRTSWDAAGSIHDLSGNAREWTNTSRGAGIYELRGGSYTNIEAGRACDFDFAVANATFSHPNTGFRCCYY